MLTHNLDNRETTSKAGHFLLRELRCPDIKWRWEFSGREFFSIKGRPLIITAWKLHIEISFWDTFHGRRNCRELISWLHNSLYCTLVSAENWASWIYCELVSHVINTRVGIDDANYTRRMPEAALFWCSSCRACHFKCWCMYLKLIPTPPVSNCTSNTCTLTLRIIAALSQQSPKNGTRPANNHGRNRWLWSIEALHSRNYGLYASSSYCLRAVRESPKCFASVCPKHFRCILALQAWINALYCHCTWKRKKQ